MFRLTNQELAKVTRMPYSKVRRWAKDFLPPDPRATRQSGYSRECTIGEGFFINLIGHLISDLKLSTHEAKRVVKDIKEWLVSKELFPGEEEERWWMESIPGDSRKYEIILMRVMVGGVAIPLQFNYLGITRLEKKQIDEGDSPIYQEVYKEEIILKTKHKIDPTNYLVVKVGELKEIFLEGMNSIRRIQPKQKGGKKKPATKKYA